LLFGGLVEPTGLHNSKRCGTEPSSAVSAPEFVPKSHINSRCALPRSSIR